MKPASGLRMPRSPRASTLSNSSPDMQIKWANGLANMCKPLRKFHSACLIDEQLYFYGGICQDGVILSELCCMNIVTLQWNVLIPMQSNNAPPALYQHSAVTWGGKMFIFGGKTEQDTINSSIFAYSLETSTWTRVHKHSRYSAKVGHSCCTYANGFLIFGGINSKNKMTNQVYYYDAETDTWNKIKSVGTSPSPRKNHSASMLGGNRMLVFGGETDQGFSDELFELDCTNWTWKKHPHENKWPSPRAGHSLSVLGDFAILLGGEDPLVEILLSDQVYVLEYFPAEGNISWDRVKVTGSSNAPMTLEGHSATVMQPNSVYIALADATIYILEHIRRKRSFAGDIKTKSLSKIRRTLVRKQSFTTDDLPRFHAPSEPIPPLPLPDTAKFQRTVSTPSPAEHRSAARLLTDKYGEFNALKTYKIKGEDLLDLTAKINELETNPELGDKEQQNLPKLQAEVYNNNLRESIASTQTALCDIVKELHLLQSLVSMVQEDEQREPMLDCIKSIEARIESISQKSDHKPKRKRTVETEVLNLHIPQRVTSVKNFAKPKVHSARFASDIDSTALNKAALLKKQIGLSHTLYFRHQSLAQQLEAYNVQSTEAAKPTEQIIRSRTVGRLRHGLVRKCSVECIIQRAHSLKTSNERDDILSSGLKRYLNVVHELVETERQYCEDLTNCSEIYIVALSEQHILNKMDIRTLFSNMQQLLDFSKEFLVILEGEAKLPTESQNFAKAFKSKSENIQTLYSTYCSNLVFSRRMKNKQLDTNPKFVSFCAAAQSHPKANRQDLKSFLIKPLQRVCKYPLLLRELAKYSPVSAQSRAISTIHVEMQNILNQVNETMVQSEQIKPLFELEDLFGSVSPIQLAQPNRAMLDKVTLVQYTLKKDRKKFKTEKCTLVLMTDLVIIYTDFHDRVVKKSTFACLRGVVPLSKCTVMSLTNQNKPLSVSDPEREFIIVNLDTDHTSEWGITRFHFHCASESECQKWINLLSEHIKINAPPRRGSVIPGLSSSLGLP